MLRILLVDDNPGDRKLFQEAIEEAGIECQLSLASGAIEGLVMLGDKRPDLIVLDVMMPGMSGYDICYSLKFDSPYKDIPILFLTGRDNEIDERISRMMGVHYMQKPYSNEELSAKVKGIFK